MRNPIITVWTIEIVDHNDDNQRFVAATFVNDDDARHAFTAKLDSLKERFNFSYFSNAHTANPSDKFNQHTYYLS